jgi:hypothetical protein
VRDESELIWKGEVVAGLFEAKVMKIKPNSHQHVESSDRDSKPEPVQYEIEMLNWVTRTVIGS